MVVDSHFVPPSFMVTNQPLVPSSRQECGGQGLAFLIFESPAQFMAHSRYSVKKEGRPERIVRVLGSEWAVTAQRLHRSHGGQDWNRVSGFGS